LLIAALAKLSEEDINSLSLGHIVRVGIDFTAADQLNSVPFVGGNPHARNSLMVDLDKAVEFFRVARPSQADQIYALQHNGQGYDVKQVGKDAKDYYEFLTTDKRPITDATFLLRINSYGEPLKPQEELLDAWIHRVVKKHGEQFSKQLYDYGYDKTTLEKLTDVILSFIPFYTCINSARAGDVEEATVSCSIDTIALLPLLGKLGSISFKLSQILGKGGLIATRNAINELALRNSVKAALLQGGAQFAEYGLLPASQAIGKKELVSLGTATLRAMDPGFELLGSISMTAVKQSLRLAQAMSPSLHKLHKLLPKLTLELERLPPKISPEAYSFARLPGFDKAVQVTKLGGDPFMGRDIYVRLHPETGEPFGRKYVLLADGTLDPVPIGLARRLHNVLKYGLGGKYAPQQGSNWAAQTTPITFTLLLQIRRDIESGANLQQLAARHSVELERLHRYISYTGELTALGRDQFELAKEARISTDAIQVRPYSIMELPRSVLSGPLLGLTYPINQLPKKLVVTLAAPVRANEAIRDNFDVIDGRIFEKNGTPYTYDIDLNGFIKDPLEESPFVYFIDKNTRQLRPSSLEEAQKQASSITIDERTAVIKGLGIDLDLSTILNNQGPVFGPKKPISKRISFLWIGNKALRPDVLTNLHMNCQIANRKGYKVYVYLSQQSEQLNYKKLVTAICGSATCGLNVSLQNQVSILETSNFYKKFKSSISFLQYQDAIDGNGGVATNFASAADILRLELLKSKGGLYMDVDDTLSDVFGDTVLEAEANGFVLPGLLMSKKPKMDHLFGTSFFGVHQDNAIIDAMLEEIHHRFQQSDNRDFYKTPRPSNTDLIGSIAYANKLSYLTGPDVFNRVLLEHQPVLTQFRKMSQLQELCERPYASKMLNEILEHMPSQAEITPLAHSYFVGNLHSWEQYRKK